MDHCWKAKFFSDSEQQLFTSSPLAFNPLSITEILEMISTYNPETQRKGMSQWSFLKPFKVRMGYWVINNFSEFHSNKILRRHPGQNAVTWSENLEKGPSAVTCELNRYVTASPYTVRMKSFFTTSFGSLLHLFPFSFAAVLLILCLDPVRSNDKIYACFPFPNRIIVPFTSLSQRMLSQSYLVYWPWKGISSWSLNSSEHLQKNIAWDGFENAELCFIEHREDGLKCNSVMK